jgi:hypothetical protein
MGRFNASAPFVRLAAGSLRSREPQHERVAPGTSYPVETLGETLADMEMARCNGNCENCGYLWG